MDKKKIGLLIIVLFLIIGLGSFVFANPDNQENLEEGDVEERDRLGSDKDSDDEEVLNEDTESDTLLTNGLDNQGSSFGNVQGNISNVNDGTGFTTGPSDDSNGNTEVPVTPDYYADALKAVENAESSLVQGDVDYAASLVDKLTNQSQKDELNKRLEAVQDIIDVTALIERLEEMVANSTNRDGILDSIDYRDNEKIEELVNDLINGNAKDDLVDRLETVNKILNDNKGPVISGIENNSFTKDDVSLTISDDNEVTTKVTLNGEEVEYTDTFTEEGTYVVTVVDAAFNETTLTFTIDKTAPEFVGLKNGMFYQNDITVEVSDKNLDKITAKVYADNYNVVEIENNSTLTKESIYLLTATDKAGNTTSIYVAVDKTAPVFTTVKNGHQYNEDIKLDVKDLKVKTIEVYSYNDKTTKTVDNGYVLTEEGTYRVTATDYSGRSTTVYVTIDKTAPSINGFEDGSYNNKSEIVYISDENLYKVTINGTEYDHDGKYFTKKLVSDGVYTIVATDRAGNITTKTVTIDKTAPEFVGLKNGMFYQDDITVEVNDTNLDKITAKVYADNYNVVEIENNSTLTKESIYLLTATDKAGNTTSIYVAVDKTAPVFTTVKNGHQYNEDIKLDVKDLKVKTIEVYSYNDKTTKTVDNGYVLTEEGTYRVTATDYSGRSTTVYVTIDKTAPSINGFEDGSYNNKSEIVYISDENLYKVTINGTEYDHDGKYFTKKLVSDGVYTIVATDRAGNITTKTVTIDKTAPEFEDPQKTMESDVTIKVIEDNLDKILVTDKISGETYEVENGHILTKEGYYKIIAYDKAGNQSDVWNLTIDNAAPVITIEDARENGYYNHDVVVNISDIELQQTYLNGERMGREDTLTIEDEGTYTVYAEDRYGHKSEEVTFTIDKTAPTITVDKLVNGVTDDGNVTVKDANDFEVVVKYNNVEKVRTTASVSKRFNISWLGEGTFEVIATDMAGNTETITFELNLLNLTAQAVGSNLIDEANNTINNFNAFAIKFDKDLTFNVASKNQKYIIEMEYSTDGVHYTKSNYKYDNQYQGLNDGNGNKYGNGLFNSYTISANSSIHWSGTKVGARWTDIYEAIKATKDTDNKVYVRTIFTVVQPSFTKSFTLDEVVYSKGGYEVTPRGLPQI